jgi:hypothetical protein
LGALVKVVFAEATKSNDFLDFTAFWQSEIAATEIR